ncbi:MAG: GxxExxY protein [Nitrospiraceae bacterium]|nr:GxxExxY protein [Nitrospiraceae bacterium]
MKKQYDNYLYSDLTNNILRCVHEVHRKLGYGFLEKVYENALIIVLTREGMRAEQQVPVIKVKFDGKVVGEYITDILVEEKVVIELKAVSELASIHEVQLVNYLKASGARVGLLINFGPKLTIKRKVF